MAAENGGDGPVRGATNAASMRPRRMAAENRMMRARAKRAKRALQ